MLKFIAKMIYFLLQVIALNQEPLNPAWLFLQQLHLYHVFQILLIVTKCSQLVSVNLLILIKIHAYSLFK